MALANLAPGRGPLEDLGVVRVVKYPAETVKQAEAHVLHAPHSARKKRAVNPYTAHAIGHQFLERDTTEVLNDEAAALVRPGRVNDKDVIGAGSALVGSTIAKKVRLKHRRHLVLLSTAGATQTANFNITRQNAAGDGVVNRRN